MAEKANGKWWKIVEPKGTRENRGNSRELYIQPSEPLFYEIYCPYL